MNKTIAILALCPGIIPAAFADSKAEKKPNILFVIADDLSFPHTSAYGKNLVSTPAFDMVAQKGCLFTNAYVTSPGCSPSRASILTGLFPWQVEEAGTHASSFPSKYLCYPEVLGQHGYFTGYTGKGWAPGNWKISGRKYNPAGPEYNDVKLKPPHRGISPIDYFENFRKFLTERPEGAPFCFWLGAHEPHRDFEAGSWKKEGMSLNNAKVPGFLPDREVIRGDLLDYAVEIEWFDKQLKKCLEELERRGEIENTLIIVTSDNGMAFPDAKANCYDSGLHVPLAICWGNRIKGSQVADALVSLVSMGPTIYDVTGIQVGHPQSGTSLLPLMTGHKEAYTADAVFAGRERHSFSRYGNLGYPVRAVRWKNYLLVHNFRPERWPAGDPVSLDEKGNIEPGAAYFDIDDSPSKTFLIENRTDPLITPYFEASVGKRPEFQLFDLTKDPFCMKNLANESSYVKIMNQLKTILNNKLISTGDTRIGNNPEIWETYPRLEGKMRNFPKL